TPLDYRLHCSFQSQKFRARIRSYRMKFHEPEFNHALFYNVFYLLFIYAYEHVGCSEECRNLELCRNLYGNLESPTADLRWIRFSWRHKSDLCVALPNNNNKESIRIQFY